MRETISYIEGRISGLPAAPALRRRELELLLELVVSTFDGLMRGMLAIAHENRHRVPTDHLASDTLMPCQPPCRFKTCLAPGRSC